MSGCGYYHGRSFCNKLITERKNVMSTIAAISTPMAVGGIGIIRISGENAQAIADKIFISASSKKIDQLKGYQALFGNVVDSSGVKIDEAIALNFLEPKSFTGENIVELSCHGGIYIL